MTKIVLRIAEANQVDYNLFDQLDSMMKYSEDDGIEIDRKKKFQNADEYNHYIEEEGTILFINVEEEDEPVGFFRMVGLKDDTIHIKDMYIKKSEQRKGYGKKAVKQLAEDVREDFNALFLMSYSLATDMFWMECGFRVNEKGFFEIKIK